MRKDIFVVGARLLGVMQLVDAILSSANLLSQWLGYINAPSYGRGYSLMILGAHLMIGLYLILRPYQLFDVMKLLAGDDDEDQADQADHDGLTESNEK